MEIVFCTDNNYVMPCGVTIISILENNKDVPITFHIIGMGLRDESKDILSSISQKYKESSVLFYEIRKEFLESYNFSLYGSKHLSLASYARLFLVDILPQNIEKVLYLDCDMIITKNLFEMWNTDIENYSIAGVPDLFCMFYTKIFEILEYSETFEYINAGMLLINLEYWRKHNLMNVFIDFYKKNHDKLSFHDQDIINGTLYDSKLLLPIKYNVIDFYYFSKRENLFQYQNEVNEAMINPVIIHYTSRDKPWFKTCLHPLKDEFLKYKNISPWNKPLLTWSNLPISKQIQHYKRIILYFLKLKKPKYLKFDSLSGKFKQ